MARPLFEIAKEISADWQRPSPQAKTYLKGMYYLLGMDDYAADLNATTTVRMFLLYSKEWTGPVAERVKAELQAMRSTGTPTNADLLGQIAFPKCDVAITHCELCDVSLGSPAKFVEGYTHWGARARMCMHCNYCNSMGLIEGDGALCITAADGTWLKLHGEPVAPAHPPAQDTAPAQRSATSPGIQFRLKHFGRRVVRKCAKIVRQLTRRSA